MEKSDDESKEVFFIPIKKVTKTAPVVVEPVKAANQAVVHKKKSKFIVEKEVGNNKKASKVEEKAVIAVKLTKK